MDDQQRIAGLTLFEVMIVITIILLLVAFTVPRLFKSTAFGGDTTQEAAQDIVNLLATGQSFAASNRDNSHWGIRLVDNGTTDCDSETVKDCAVLYKGNDFDARDTSYDQRVLLSEGNRFNMLDDIDFYFNKKTGYSKDLYGLPTRGLVGYWPFTASTTLDLSDKGNNGSFMGVSNHVTTTCAMDSGCFNFDGTEDYVDVAYSGNLNITGDISLAAWIKRGDTANASAIIAKASSGTVKDYDLYISNEASHIDELRFYTDGGSGTYYDSGATITDTANWHHVVFTRSGTSWQFYVDGAAAGSGSSGQAFTGGNRSVLIGYDTYANSYFNGYIDEPLIYTRGLSALEAVQLYNTTKPTSTSAGERTFGTIYIINGVATSTITFVGNGAAQLTHD